METKKKKELGQALNISLEMTVPEKFKAVNMDLNKLVLMCGTNSTGKSFIMKMIWLLSSQMTHSILCKNHGLPGDDKIGAQFLLNNTYDDNNFTGEMSLLFEFGNHITIKAENGIVLDCVVSIEDDMEDPGQPNYLSTETRLIGNTVKYLQIKKMLGLGPGLPVIETDFIKLLEIYKIYDILLMERLLDNIENYTPSTLKNLNKSMKNFDENFTINDMKVDHKKPDILYSDDKNSYISVTRLGSGHQSLMTMLIASDN